MPNYGFVIDQRKCIGCHACTTACKSENEVPLGVFRTWVKSVETGQYPNTRRHFLVERCNHCANSPCTTICPTTALFRRGDGIVDFDSARCIGCKACMQACPYDAIYIDPDTNTAAKCNFCAHRVDLGLQPACVSVCPVEAIISGDIDDPNSTIAQLLGRESVQQRRPDQNTQPKLWYVGADQSALNPETFTDPQGSMWAEHRDMGHGSKMHAAAAADAAQPKSRAPGQSVAAGYLSEGGGQVNYNVAHEQPWGFLVSLYLWTKSLGAGAFLLAWLAAVIGLATASSALSLAAPALALVFIGITSVLLVADLQRPERFWYLLAKPNWSSWLVIGAYILMAFSGVAFIWLALALLGVRDEGVFRAFMWAGAILAAAAAAYSAWLFGQAEGRDFWQSPLLAPHLLVQAALAGSAGLLLLDPLLNFSGPQRAMLATALGISVVAHLALAGAELYTPHANAHVRLAAHTLSAGRLRWKFWWGAVALGVAATLAGLAFGLPVLAAVCALAGLLLYEDAWVTAGQSVPMS